MNRFVSSLTLSALFPAVVRKNIRNVIIAVLSLAGISVCAFAQVSGAAKTAGIGVPYGSRDPRPCGDLTGSVPTQQKALNSFVCHEENVRQLVLHLIENASLQIGNPRGYNMKEDYNVPNIDIASRVYPIRGSFKEYSCVPFSDYMKNKGRNCSLAQHPNATGLCYRDTWGNWLCSMGDVSFSITDTEAPPPGGSVAMAPPREVKGITQPVKVPEVGTAAGRPAGPTYPRPDFSEMEKWFEILRYEYGDNVNDHNLYFWVKAKVSNPPSFCMQFLDRDGMMVDAYDSSCGTGIHMGYSAPESGQLAKFDVPMPQEKHMPRVASARVFRAKQ